MDFQFCVSKKQVYWVLELNYAIWQNLLGKKSDFEFC